MTSGNRYKSDPRRIQGKLDVFEVFENTERRLRAGETSYRAGHTAIEDGDFVVRNGDIIVSETDDTVVLQIVHGSIPEVRLFPQGVVDPEHWVSILGASPIDTLTAGQMEITQETSPGVYDTDGGRVLVWADGALLAHTPFGGTESFLWLNYEPEVMLMVGKWLNQIQASTSQAVYTGVIDVVAGFGSWTHTYFAPFVTTMAPVVGLLNTAGALTWNLTAVSTSGFTVSWTGTLAKTIYFWNFRTD